jgi:hypothetical protein
MHILSYKLTGRSTAFDLGNFLGSTFGFGLGSTGFCFGLGSCFDNVIDLFAKQPTQSVSDPADPFKQKTGYSPTHKTTDIANRKIEQ